MKSLEIKIFGKVQAVGFRFNTKYQAEKFNIKGFVRNESDGSLCIEAEGKEKDIEKFIEWCKDGPETAKVKRIEVEDINKKNFKKFEIEY